MITNPKPAFVAITLFGAIFLFSACGPHLDGSSENAFKTSYQNLKKGLSSTDTAKLNAAIKVLGLSMMGEKMRGDKVTPSVNNQLRKQLDGKTYPSVISMAEDSLKSIKQREIAFIQKQITDLQTEANKRKAPYDALKKQLSIIQGSFVKIDQVNGTPTAHFEFKNTSTYEIDHFSLTSVIRSSSKKKIVTSGSQVYGGVKTLRHNDTLHISIPITDFSKSETPEVPWSTITYPVTDLSHYNMFAEAYADEFKIDDKDYDLSTVKWSDDDQQDYEQKLRDLQTQLKEAQSRSEDLNNL